MNTFISPEAVAIPMSGFATSDELDKALVYDKLAGHYVLMSTEMAQIEVAVAKQSARKSWLVRSTQVIVLCLVSGLLGFIASEMGGDSMRTALKIWNGSASEVATRSPAPVQPPAMGFAITAPTPVSAASDSAATAFATGASAPIPLPQASEAVQAVLVAAATPSTPPANPPIAMASAVPVQTPAVNPAPVAVQVARFPIAATSAPVVAEPVVKASPPPPTVTTQVAKPVESPKPASTKEVAKNTQPATKVTKVVTVQATPPTPKVAPPAEVQPPKPVQVSVGVQRVSAQGVHYFDGSANKLFAVGSTLPNGEKIIDVDEPSGTYATDKGIRQIRTSKP